MTLTKIASTGVEDSLRWVLGANGTSDYTFTGPGLNGTVNDPTIYLTRGHTYIFQNNSGGHPFYIKTSTANGGTNDAYNTGVTNNGGGNGTEIVFTVPHDSPDILYYQCSSHAAMAGQFNIAGSVADGSISTAKIADDAVNNDKLANSVVASIAANTAKTSNATHTGDVTGSTSLTIANDAVTTAKIANDAVTSPKIASNAITTAKINNGEVTNSKLAANAVTADKINNGEIITAKIADTAVTLAKLEHGTSSNDGKFLRANNGADPSFETVTSTTINNQGDDRVITGDANANTLNAESNVVIKSGNVGIGLTNPNDFYSPNLVVKAPSEGGITIRNTNSGDWNYIMFASGDSGAARYDSYIGVDHGNNKVRISTNESVSAKNVELRSDGNFHLSDGNVVFASGHGIDFSATGNAGNSASMSNELFDDYEEGTWTPFFYAWIGGGVPATHDTQIGRYTKVGNLVHITYDLKGDRGSMNHNYITIGGLPFTYSSSNKGWASIPWTEYVGSENSTSATRGHGLQFGGGATAHAWLTGYTNTSSYLPTYLSTSYMSNSNHTRIRGSATYFTNQ